MTRALVVVCMLAGVASADTVLVNVATDHAAGEEQIAELRAAPAASWGPNPLVAARSELEAQLAPTDEPGARVKKLLADADAKYLELDLAGTTAKLDAAERVLAEAEVSETIIGQLRDINLRRAQVEIAAKQAAKADAWLALAIRLGAETIDAKRFPPDVRRQHKKVLAAEQAAKRSAVAITTTPERSLRCIDATLTSTSTAQLAAGEHYVCAASPGYRSAIARVTPHSGEIAIELEQLPRAAAIAQIRASLARSGFADDTARPPARVLAKLVGVDRLVFVDGKAVWVYTLADDRIAKRRSSALGLQDETVGVVRGDDRPWYGSKWWLIGGAAVIAAGVASYFIVTAEDTYSTGDFMVRP